MIFFFDLPDFRALFFSFLNLISLINCPIHSNKNINLMKLKPRAKKTKSLGLSKNNRKKQKLYEVEEILDERLVENKREFLVKWKNYPPSKNSWEPVENLTRCQFLLQKFLISKMKEKIPKKTIRKIKNVEQTKISRPNKTRINYDIINEERLYKLCMIKKPKERRKTYFKATNSFSKRKNYIVNVRNIF